MRAVVSVESIRENKKSGEVTRETRYYITSKVNASAEKIAHTIRGHWGIENQLHWMLDVIFGEDKSRKRAGNSAENFSRVQRLAMMLLKQYRERAGEEKKSLRRIMLEAMVDTEILDEILIDWGEGEWRQILRAFVETIPFSNAFALGTDTPVPIKFSKNAAVLIPMWVTNALRTKGLQPHGCMDLFPTRGTRFASIVPLRATLLRLTPSLRTSYLVLDLPRIFLPQSHRSPLSLSSIWDRCVGTDERLDIFPKRRTITSDGMIRITFTALLLVLSNTVMTFAWYGFLRKPGEAVQRGLWKLILISWGLAFFEYCLMIPANHLGRSAGLSLAQLKIMQEVITLSIFVPFMLFYMGEQWKWDYLWAFLCLLGAVFFVNREALMVS